MSNQTDSDPIAPEGAPAETGLAESEQTGVEASQEQPDPEPAEPEYDVLDLDEFGDKYVQVKVGGETMTVPLSEALGGYMREADYTQKRQQDAADVRIARALQADPASTIQALARRHGMTVEEYAGLSTRQQQQLENEYQEDPPPSDPVERKLWEQERRIEAMQQRFAEQELHDRIQRGYESLQQQYDATPEEALEAVQSTHALAETLRQDLGPEMFPLVLQALRYQRSMAEQQAAQEFQQRNAAQDAQRQAAAAAANDVVGTGSSVSQQAMAQGGSAANPTTTAEALRLALEQHQVKDLSEVF